MVLRIAEVGVASLEEYGRVPIAFTSASRLDLDALAAGEWREIPVALWTKDYDALPENAPSGLAARFDLTRWGVLAAFSEGAWVGGAIVAWDTPGVEMLEGRRDLGVLWDLRVAPEWRGRGVGGGLFAAVEVWLRARGGRELWVETQDVNAPACRFYRARGCRAMRIVSEAYPECPDEAQIVWGKDL